MVQRVSTVAFEGIEARAVDVQVQVAPGLPAFAMVSTIDPSETRRGYKQQVLIRERSEISRDNYGVRRSDVGVKTGTITDRPAPLPH